ncbi:MAG: polysaccharide deacetylase family protein [Treponema sp.]|nr:polysaccharide deacetylase family protein [Treponema sp.]
MVKNRKSLFLFLYLVIFIFNLSAVNFNDLNLSSDDRLLFNAEFEKQKTLFISRLTDMSMRQLTAFPEKLHLVDNGRMILALSRFGAVKIPAAGGLPETLAGYPSFTQGDIPLKGRLQDIAASADGKWFLYIEPVTTGFGNLFLVNISNGTKRIISERVELPGSDFPARWSPDSRLFVYSKGGRLFYVPILDDTSMLIDERFRMIGTGGITSVLWGKFGDFYYFSGNTLYKVKNPELFTRTVYGDFLSVGRVVATLPFDFDSNFDRYWLAPDSNSILVNKGTKNLFLFKLDDNRSKTSDSSTPFLPHIQIPFAAEYIEIMWSSSETFTVSYFIGNQFTAVRYESFGHTFTTYNNRQNVLLPNRVLSPDGTKIVFWGENGIELWDFINWRLIQRIDNNEVYSCVWLNDRSIITGNSRFIEEINVSVSSYPRRKIALSGADEAGFEETAGSHSRILVKAGNEWYVSDGSSPWLSVNNVQLRQTTLASDRFRVFLEPQASGHFRNVPMVRNLQATGTFSLVSNHKANNIYTLVRQTQIALCFDLYDDDTGLAQVLAALRRFNIRVTFFLNGEFIRRNPAAASAITEAGHETASMFYAPVDFSDSRYRITREFITHGLARNEDEFYRATGRELSVLWHSPFYRSSNIINEAAASIGYRTVNRTIDPGDWVSREDSLRHNLRQIPPAEMLDQLMQQLNQKRHPGAIVPIRLGLLPGSRDEYLFQRIDVLLDALIRCGYEIVPVSAVINR